MLQVSITQPPITKCYAKCIDFLSKFAKTTRVRLEKIDWDCIVNLTIPISDGYLLSSVPKHRPPPTRGWTILIFSSAEKMHLFRMCAALYIPNLPHQNSMCDVYLFSRRLWLTGEWLEKILLKYLGDKQTKNITRKKILV